MKWDKRSVGWLLDETMGRPGLPGLCILGRTSNQSLAAEYIEIGLIS